MNPRWTVILPTLNEEENIPVLVEEILRLSVPDLEILVVDDASTDETIPNLRKKFPNEIRLRIIERKGKKPGLVNSLNDGIEHSTAEFIIWMDADRQMPANKILEFVSLMQSGEFTAVLGSRFLAGGADERDDSYSLNVVGIHKTLSWALNQFTRQILGLKTTDVTSGFICIRREFFKSRKLEGVHGDYFILLASELQRMNANFTEVPYRLGPRISGTSKSSQGSLAGLFLNGLHYLRIVAKLYFRRVL